MKLGIRQITPVVLTLAVVGFVQACTGSNSTQVNTSTFETAELAINPAEVYPGVEFIITAQITNTGDNEAVYAAGLRLDDETVATEEITVTAGTSQPVSFVGSISTPGTYQITWAERVGEFLVPRLSGEAVIVGDESADSSVSDVAAPDFTAMDVITGETISLSQFSGSTILLNFVNYGCNPSTNKVVGEQLLAIRELKEQRDDFVPISVFCGCCPIDVLRDFATQNQLTWPWILDTDYSIVRDYSSHLRKYGYPTLILIDMEQQIREVSGYCDVSTLTDKIDQISQ
jgi:peroxiredoxin